MTLLRRRRRVDLDVAVRHGLPAGAATQHHHGNDDDDEHGDAADGDGEGRAHGRSVDRLHGDRLDVRHALQHGKERTVYLTTHSTHFIYRYMVSDILYSNYIIIIIIIIYYYYYNSENVRIFRGAQ